MPPNAPVVAALFGGALLLYVHSRNAKRVAATKLRAAFATALATIEAASRHDEMDPNRPKVSIFLRESFIDHAAAVQEYRWFVSGTSKRAYEQAWQQYRELAYDRGEIGAVFLAQVASSDAPLTFIRGRIHAVLSFADA